MFGAGPKTWGTVSGGGDRACQHRSDNTTGAHYVWCSLVTLQAAFRNFVGEFDSCRDIQCPCRRVPLIRRGCRWVCLDTVISVLCVEWHQATLDTSGFWTNLWYVQGLGRVVLHENMQVLRP